MLGGIVVSSSTSSRAYQGNGSVIFDILNFISEPRNKAMSRAPTKKSQDLVQEYELKDEYAEVVSKLSSYTNKVHLPPKSPTTYTLSILDTRAHNR